MRLLKSHPILGLANSYMIDSPQPASLSYMWNFGSLLGVCLIIQIVTGITLAMHYTPNIDLAFISVEHIMRDVHYGWLIRYLHANVASFFFIFVYLHIGRGLYYGSYRSPRTLLWAIGVIILVLMMATAFLGYVLPYGQMSLWGATVITNLLSAIPWIGTDFVQFVYNPKYTSLTCTFVFSICLLSTVLPTIGQINWSKLRGQAPLADKSQYLQIPFSFLATLAGLIDGDGYISITRTTKGTIEVLLAIALDIKDELMLRHIQTTLGFGRIAGPFTNKNGSQTIKLIFSRTDLQQLLFPLFLHHGIFFLTDTRRTQFNLAMYIFSTGLTRFDEMPSTIPTSPLLPSMPTIAAAFLELPFFMYWIVGFTIAEGSFLVKANNDACFQLNQRLHSTLFEALKLVFGTNRKIGIELGKYHKLSVSSKKDVQTVIDFFSTYKTLMGNKLVQYNKWLDYLKSSQRYGGLKF